MRIHWQRRLLSLQIFSPRFPVSSDSPPTLARLSIAFIPTQAGTALIHSMLSLCTTRAAAYIYGDRGGGEGGLCMALLSPPPLSLYPRVGRNQLSVTQSLNTLSYGALVIIYVFVCFCICVHLYLCVFVFVFICICVHLYLCICVNTPSYGALVMGPTLQSLLREKKAQPNTVSCQQQ